MKRYLIFISYFKNLLVIITGHGTVSNYYNSHYIVINDQERIYANELEIGCSNLTIVVNSCYSNRWYSDFSHKALNHLFTSDFCNNVSSGRHQYLPEPYTI